MATNNEKKTKKSSYAVSAVSDTLKISPEQEKVKVNASQQSTGENPLVWRSVEQYDNSRSKNYGKVAMRGEFPESVQKLIERGANAHLNRKTFLTLMGASLTMASISCVKRPVEKIIPYVNRPDDLIPGESIYFASNYHNAEGVSPILVKTMEGKPQKIDGLPSNPHSQGAISANAMAAIWDLYDPDRIKASGLKVDGAIVAASYDDLELRISKLLNSAKNISIISRVNFSPSETKVVNAFLAKYKTAKQIVYDAVGDIQEVQNGDAISYGTAVVPSFSLDKAELIFSIDADVLGSYLDAAAFTKAFSKKRNLALKNMMTRLVCAETMMSVTGANADERLPIRSGSQVHLALSLAQVLAPNSAFANLGNTLAAFAPEKVAGQIGVSAEKIRALAEELKKNAGKSLVIGGGVTSRIGKSGALQIAVNLLNSILGNEGITVSAKAPLHAAPQVSPEKELLNLIQQLNEGVVDVLIINNCNPVFDLPASLNVGDAIKKAKHVIFIGTHAHESAKSAKTVLALSHQLESWSDTLSNGIYGVAQPTIKELYQTKSFGDIWLMLGGSKQTMAEVVKETARTIAKTPWATLLAKGFSVVEERGGQGRRFNNAALDQIIKLPKQSAGSFTLGLYKSVQIGDGTGANIAFRQELPDPITKITWDNYLAVSSADAKKLKLSSGQMVVVSANGIQSTLPVFVQPGMANGSLAIAIGYGHTSLGKVANKVGFAVNQFTQLTADGYVYSGIPAEIKKAGKKYVLATTQLHHAIEDTVDAKGTEKRVQGLVRTTTLSQFLVNPKSGNEYDKLPGKGLYKPHEYKSYRWGMNIDLNKCTGCSACVIGCISENNVPAVGKQQVHTAKDMHWIRIDRYYTGDVNNPQVLFQPLMCQHCENAPCENVCPVAATTHDSEGLNNMTYNRCIGTRYCANDCPFKVRRFNWFENWKGKLADPQQYALNPNVTVRERGVIEKCSFCVQRIAEKKIVAKKENRPLYDGEVQTACQQACPADAITFGNINDEKSEISKLNKNDRSYRLLEDLNVKPSVVYMVKVRKDYKA